MAQLPNWNRVFKQSLTPSVEISIDDPNRNQPQVLPGNKRNELSRTLLEAVTSKLVKDPKIDEKRDPKTKEFDNQIGGQQFKSTIDDTITSIQNARNLLDALPDLALVKDIIISSVLSPNDMMSTELIYNNESDLFDDLTVELTEQIKYYFNETYGITELLHEWLERSLFIEGAMPIGVIPESSIDHAINTHLKITQESVSAEIQKGKFVNYGLLSTPKYLKPNSNSTSVSLENIGVGFSHDSDYKDSIGVSKNGNPNPLKVTVIDNPNVLKLPRLSDKIRRDKISTVYGKKNTGLESYRTAIYKDKYNRTINSSDELHPTREGELVPVLKMKTLDQVEKDTVGHPVVFYFPMESVIPVYSPSDPSNHICYFIALDEHGNPLRMEHGMDQLARVQNNFNSTMNSNTDIAGSMINTANRMGIQDVSGYDKESMAQMAELYNRIIEQDLIDRLDESGLRGKELKLGETTEIFRLMFARALDNMGTQLLFMPGDLLTYIAFDYKPNGVGRSLLDKTKVIGSLRMVNTMAEAIAAAKSAIDHRRLEIKLDEDDPDPMRRVEQYLHEFQRATKASFPMGVNSFADISDYLQKAGLQVAITGHEGVPDMSMEMNNVRYDYNRPDDSYSEDLSNKHTMSLGAPPESIKSSEDIEFATSIISSNIFFAKISLWRQTIFAKHVSDHIQKYVLNSQPLISQLTKIIEDNRENLPKIDKKFSSEAAAIVFASNITVELPRPDVAQSKMQGEAFDEYTNILEKALPAFISTDLLDSGGLGDKLGESVDHIVAVLTAHFQRKWLMDNNVMPELFDLVNTTEDASEKFEFLETQSKFLDELTPNLRKFVIENLQRGSNSDKVVEKAEEMLDTEAGGYDSDSGDTGGGDDFGGESGDEDMGDDFGDDMGMGDEEGESDESGDEDSEDDDFDFDF